MTIFDDGQELLKDVREFHEKFCLGPLTSPGFLPNEHMKSRLDFIQEEFDELKTAVFNEDIVEAFDALIDIVYVVVGTAYLMGLPMGDGWDEVHSTNMAKVRVARASDSKRKSEFDVVKPEGWRKPNLGALLHIVRAAAQQVEKH